MAVRHKGGEYRQLAKHDRALDFTGPVSFANHVIQQGADASIDAESGKLTVTTDKGFAVLPGDPRYSYGQKRQAMHNLQNIGIAFLTVILLIVLLALPFICQ